jgi:hypothetical protein
MTKDKTPEPPGAVSDQNAEEAPSEHEDRDFGLRRPRAVDTDHGHGEDHKQGEKDGAGRDGAGASEDGGAGEDGGASEGTQSTGHPESAG